MIKRFRKFERLIEANGQQMYEQMLEEMSQFSDDDWPDNEYDMARKVCRNFGITNYDDVNFFCDNWTDLGED